MPDLKKIIAQEYLKCAKDPIHFLSKYCYISHPQRGRILFNLYPFQKAVIKSFLNEDYNIVLKSRQLGISTLSAGYSLWLMLFHEDRNILALATTQTTARNLVSKVQFMYENLPSWLKVDYLENNKLSLQLKNGSKIHAKPSSPDAARSEAVSFLIIDEAAFIRNIATTWASAQQTLATGGAALVLSTPNGVGNWFHQMWSRAELGENEFIPIKLRWDVHPERDQKWRDDQDQLLGDPRLAAQECDCSFNSSGDTVFYTDYIEYFEKTYQKPPLEKRGADQNLWIWESPNYTKDYIVVADVARGDGKDYSAFHIIEIESNTQVGEYKGQIPTKDFGHLLVGVATEYNNALLVVENANIGWNTIQVILDRQYQNLYYSPRGGAKVDAYFDKYMDVTNMVPGFTMSTTTRPMVVGKIQEVVNDQEAVIQSKRLLEEMKVFTWHNGKAQAQQGYNDDLVMSYGISQYIRSTALKARTLNLEATKNSLNSMSTSKVTYTGGYSPTDSDNPYSMDVHGNQEDISWLLK